MAKVILAYSGGLDTSVILKWLIEKGYDVMAYVANLGQEEDFGQVKEKAMAVGASNVHVVDLRREFVTDYIFVALRGSALYEGRYLLGTSLARPLIAKKQIEIAKKEKASAVAHGATGKGNDQVRFELAYLALSPGITIIAPWKDEEFLDQFNGRSDLIDYATKHGIEVKASPKAPYSTDPNLMHISYEAGILEDPKQRPAKEMYKMTVDPLDAPDKVTNIAVHFEQGTPVKVVNSDTGETEQDPLRLFCYLNELGAANGIGRIDIVENRYVGIKSRGVYETPGATILWKAHQDLETICMDREVYRIKESLVPRFAQLIYDGYWFSPEMEFLTEVFDKSQGAVSGVVYIELYKGNVNIVGREAKGALYNQELASMDVAGGYDQKDAAGFIRVNALRLQAQQRALKK